MNKDDAKLQERNFFKKLKIVTIYCIADILIRLLTIGLFDTMYSDRIHNILILKLEVIVSSLQDLLLLIVILYFLTYTVIFSFNTGNEHKKTKIIVSIVSALIGISLFFKGNYKYLYETGSYMYDICFNGIQIEEISDYEVHAYAFSDNEKELNKSVVEKQISKGEDICCELKFKEKEYGIDPEDYMNIINDEDGKIKIGYYKIMGKIVSIDQE